MQTPDMPRNEETRLETLRSLEILETSSEERFDRLTRLARRMFNVPIALVSLVDENRQWFKSCMGLTASETPRDISFCGHAILGEDIFLIEDASKDERFSDNPLVTDPPNIRFYAGCPLKHLDGSKLGTLCIIDTKPHTLDSHDLEALRDLAEMAERELAAIQLATLDELTNISNRRGFLTLAQKNLNLCKRKGITSTIVFLDLNNFKPINDVYGHSEGDRALTAFSNLMQETFRDSDIFARIGGDEFAVLLSDTDLDGAEEVIDRFHASLKSFNQKARRGYDIEFCYGMVNTANHQDSTVENLLNRADALMYEKKCI